MLGYPPQGTPVADRPARLPLGLGQRRGWGWGIPPPPRSRTPETVEQPSRSGPGRVPPPWLLHSSFFLPHCCACSLPLRRFYTVCKMQLDNHPLDREGAAVDLLKTILDGLIDHPLEPAYGRLKFSRIALKAADELENARAYLEVIGFQPVLSEHGRVRYLQLEAQEIDTTKLQAARQQLQVLLVLITAALTTVGGGDVDVLNMRNLERDVVSKLCSNSAAMHMSWHRALRVSSQAMRHCNV